MSVAAAGQNSRGSMRRLFARAGLVSRTARSADDALEPSHAYGGMQ